MVAHHTDDRILLLPGEGGWELPHFDPGRPAIIEVGPSNTWASETLGAEIAVLRCVYFHVVEDKKHLEALLAAENHGAEWLPSLGGRWFGLEELGGIDFAVSEHRQLVETWLLEERDASPPQRSPWAHRGWFRATESWIREEAGKLGMSPTGRLEQLKTWGISCVLRQPTDAGALYFKAVPTLFAQEPLITQHLSRRFPGHVPPPLAYRVEAGQSWMLLKDIGGGVARDSTLTLRQWEDLLGLLGRIQRESVGYVDDLLRAGCADRRLDLLASQIDELFSDQDATGELTETEVETLRAYAPRLKIMCAELADCGIPQTLVHGDFHTGNVSLVDEGYIIFDWTDACITHPFFDLSTIFDWGVPDEMKAPLRESYLRGWREYASEETIVRADKLVRPLGALHHAVSYRNIVAALEPTAKWEMLGGSTVWLRSLLEWIEADGQGGSVGSR
jgi:aminoglycoside phosphotransferase (APT) family kinase protein